MVTTGFSNLWNEVMRLVHHRNALKRTTLTKFEFSLNTQTQDWSLCVVWADYEGIGTNHQREETVLFDTITLLTVLIEKEEKEEQQNVEA